jgi:predicted dehydrogenase
MSSGQSVFRIGIVGAGTISRLHLSAIGRHPDRARVVALCDPDRGTLAMRAAEYAGAGLDVALVCTPTHVRRQVLQPLLEAGIPVFCEKPLAETYAEAVEIAHLARSLGVPIAVNQNFRRHFSFHLAREILEHGGLGRPLHLIQTTAYLRRHTGWRLERPRYVMAVMTIHWLDGYRYLLGAEPETVYCRTVNSSATGGAADTAASLILQFSQGTAVCLSESFSSFSRQDSCTLDCETGVLLMGYQGLTEIHADGSRVEHQNPFDKAEATWYLLDDLMRSVEGGREPETCATDNLRSMRIMEAAYRSAAENRTVFLEEMG